MRRFRGCAIFIAIPSLLFIILFVMQGCEGGSPELRSEEVVGVWKGSGGGRIEFRADGTFDMSGIPRSAIELSSSTTQPGKGSLSGRGEWEMEWDRDPSSGVEISFADGTESALLEITRIGDEPEMYFELNVDTDRGYRVRREASDRRGSGQKG
ncbi:hypothetical protein ACFYXM_14520 [Streptomyces sp. NPDC002476]|uniref:hypothetical protein n=1 Tax=Streptomyces sp. NPDC002476 TaxID=3364648 RepID=UPI00367DE80F